MPELSRTADTGRARDHSQRTCDMEGLEIADVSREVVARLREIPNRAELMRLTDVAECSIELLARYRAGGLKSIGFDKTMRLAQHLGVAYIAPGSPTKGVARVSARRVVVDLTEQDVKLIEALHSQDRHRALGALLDALDKEAAHLRDPYAKAALAGTVAMARVHAQPIVHPRRRRKAHDEAS